MEIDIILLMRMSLLPAFLFFFSTISHAYLYDFSLSRKLKRDFEKQISKTACGKKLLSKFRRNKYPLPEILLRPDKRGRFASYGINENKIYFNTRFIFEFFASKPKKTGQTIRILYKRKDAREEWVKYADSVFIHELVHAFQNWKYPNFRFDMLSGNMTEFEYEAYLVEDMYFHEKAKSDPETIKKFLRGEYTDPYLEHAMASYLNLSLDLDEYRKRIEERYESDEGYVSMDAAIEQQRGRVKSEKIIAYASGRVNVYLDNVKQLEQIEKARLDYSKFIQKFYDEIWPDFSIDALEFLGKTALEVENYPLALNCLAVADIKSERFSKEKIKRLKEDAAIAILRAGDFISDNKEKMDIAEMSQNIKALETACKKTGRPFPKRLAKLRREVYRKAIKYYLSKLGSAEEEEAEYFRKNIEFFTNALKP